MVVTLAATTAVIPEERRGVNARPAMPVAFSADRGVVVSGYQFPDRSTVAIPGDATWLK
jgi:hypothetical protein